jgi:hypothetical protein
VNFMYSAVSWFISEYQRWGSESLLMVVLGASFLSVSRFLLTASKAVQPAVASEPRIAPVRPTIRLPKERTLRTDSIPPVLVASREHEQVEVEVN